jgi:hypothetical protein
VVSEKAPRMRAFTDKQIWEKHQARVARAWAELDQREMFPSTTPSSRGAVSPLGGTARPMSEKGSDRR